MSGPLLPNEVKVDVAGKCKKEVLKTVVDIIDSYKPLLDYDYQLDNERNYLSWVQNRNLKQPISHISLQSRMKLLLLQRGTLDFLFDKSSKT